LQLGYVYADGAIVSDGAPSEPGSPSDYVPTAQPGARLPHAWLDGVGGRSTLDLVPIDRPVLIAFGDHERWARELGDATVDVVRVGAETPNLDSWRELCGVDDGGALLVRPDQHVAWRACDTWSASELGRALDVVAGRAEIGSAT
jgi:2,4-dichlorophenol 6-monooxygenase